MSCSVVVLGRHPREGFYSSSFRLGTVCDAEKMLKLVNSLLLRRCAVYLPPFNCCFCYSQVCYLQPPDGGQIPSVGSSCDFVGAKRLEVLTEVTQHQVVSKPVRFGGGGAHFLGFGRSQSRQAFFDFMQCLTCFLQPKHTLVRS